MVNDISEIEYEELLNHYKYKFPKNYVDLVHDLLLEKNTISECYSDFSKHIDKYENTEGFDAREFQNEIQCKKCLEILPTNVFGILRRGNKIYVRNSCNKCRMSLDSTKLERARKSKLKKIGGVSLKIDVPLMCYF